MHFLSKYALYQWSMLVSRGACQTLAKSYPDHAGYPNLEKWNALNSSLKGDLVKVIPAATVCYEPNFDEEECKAVASALTSPDFVAANPVEIFWGNWDGDACPPIVTGEPGPAGACGLGNYSDYVVEAKNAEDVSLGLKFAKLYNLRVVVKGTGHELQGRNIGRGSLGILTHNIRGIAFTDNWTPASKGDLSDLEVPRSAVVYGSGERWIDLYTAGYPLGKVVVGGETTSVGAGGGYWQGGGHSPLSNHYGLAVDNILEVQVVLPSGEIVITNEHQYQDLFWALRGGGGSTYGIVTQVTAKTHEKPIIAGLNLTFTPKEDFFSSYLEASTYFLTEVPGLIDGGLSGYLTLDNASFNAVMLAPNKTRNAITTLMEPIISHLSGLEVSVSTVVETGDQAFKIAYVNASAGLRVAVGSRLFSKMAMSNQTMMRTMLEDLIPQGYILRPFAIGGGKVVENQALSIGLNPAWRETYVHFSITSLITGTSYEALVRSLSEMTLLEDEYLAPYSIQNGAYFNEANGFLPSWKESFFGVHYDTLLSIKQRYDPTNLLWCLHCVGSDVFTLGSDALLYKSYPAVSVSK